MEGCLNLNLNLNLKLKCDAKKIKEKFTNDGVGMKESAFPSTHS
jgi:hypothetical protein